MKNQNTAGSAGKGFYAALSLSVAMVGAACWYAYRESGRVAVQQRPESSITMQEDARQTTAPVTSRTTTVHSTTITTASAEAEEAAAILNRGTTTAQITLPTTTTPVSTKLRETEPAATTAPVEFPIVPVSGVIIQGFSGGELVKSKTTGIWATHNGTDYAAPIGTEVVCTLDGTVTAVEHDALWGVCVTVLHDTGAVTRYCGLSEGLNVQAGDIIPRGTVIGAIGDTNEAESALEPHLHYEVKINGSYVDPESFLLGVYQAETTAVAADS